MDFAPTPEQQLLRSSVERFVREQYPIETRRADVHTAPGFNPDHWRQFAELGWLALPVPEAFGGLGGDAGDLMVLMEALGEGIVVSPYLATIVLGTGLVTRAGQVARHGSLVEQVIAGQRLLALADAEAPSRYNPAHVTTTAVRQDDRFVLNGAKRLVLFGGAADTLVVCARTSGELLDRDGLSLFLVDAGSQGLSRRSYLTVDATPAADVVLDDVAVAGDALLGPEGGALPPLERTLADGALAVCAEAVGAMTVLFDTTTDYMKTREQFGRPLSAFQVVRHRIADMYIACEQARSAVMNAALAPDKQGADWLKAVSAAKLRVGEAAAFVGENAVQLHGGIGMTEELKVGHYYKRLLMIDALFGDQEEHARRMAAL